MGAPFFAHFSRDYSFGVTWISTTSSASELTSVVETARMSGITEGAPVVLSTRPGAVHVFDPQTGRHSVGTHQHPTNEGQVHA